MGSGWDEWRGSKTRLDWEEFVAEDVPENHVVSEDVGMLTGVTELEYPRCSRKTNEI